MAEEKEKKDSSAVGKINNAIGKGRDIRRAYKIAKTGRTMAMAAEGAGALLSNPAGWAILAIILVLTITFFAFFGGAPIAIGGDLSNSPSPTDSSSPGPTTPPGGPVDASNVIAKLKSDFNIVVQGDSNLQHLITIYNIISTAATSPLYKQLLTCGGNTLTITIAAGDVPSLTGANTITLRNFFSSGKSFASQSNLLIHESGHVIRNRNCNRVSQAYPYSALISQDTACYDFGFLRSYALRPGNHSCNGPYNPVATWSISENGESFAESIADYVTYKTYTNSGYLCSTSLTNVYKSLCPNTYNWIKNNIFSGVEF